MAPALRRRPPGQSWLRRVLAAAGAAVLVAVVALVATTVGGGSPPRRASSTTRPSSTAGSSPSTTTGKAAATAPTSYPVGTVSMQLPTPGGELPTVVRYPAVAGSGGGPGAPADLRHGPYPLIVFSQGFHISPEAYRGILEPWAAAGYVVVDPTYPADDPVGRTTTPPGQRPAGPSELDAVIADLQADSRAPNTPVSGLIDGAKVAVAGHSDGGDLSLAVADNSAWKNPAVKAAIILSGAEYAPLGGSYFPAGMAPVPMLVTQGTADTVNPPSCSVQLYDAAPPPKYYLSLLGATHRHPYGFPGPDQTAVISVSTDFLNAVLRSEPGARAAMAAAGSVPGVAVFTSAATAPPGTPTNLACPGAP